MFERKEKLKRLEAEEKLAEALEKLASTRDAKDRLAVDLGRLAHVEETNRALQEKVESLTGKLRDQLEAELSVEEFVEKYSAFGYWQRADGMKADLKAMLDHARNRELRLHPKDQASVDAFQKARQTNQDQQGED